MPLPELSSFHVSVRYGAHWGIGLTLSSGRLHVAVPDSGQGPLRIALGDRSIAVMPGSRIALDLR